MRPLKVGVWYCQWSLAQGLLKRKQLFGSGVILKGFECLEDSVSHVRTSKGLTVEEIKFVSLEDCEDVYRAHRQR